MAVVADSLASFDMTCHLQAPGWPSLFLYAYLTGVHDFPDIVLKIISPVWIMMAWWVFGVQCTATTVVSHAFPMGVSRIPSEQGITHLSPVPPWLHSHENSSLGPHLSTILIILCINFFVLSLIHDTYWKKNKKMWVWIFLNLAQSEHDSVRLWLPSGRK